MANMESECPQMCPLYAKNNNIKYNNLLMSMEIRHSHCRDFELYSTVIACMCLVLKDTRFSFCYQSLHKNIY
jgi:hypothetical protein